MMSRFSFKKQKQKLDVYDTHTHTNTRFFGCITGTSAYSNTVFFASRISGLLSPTWNPNKNPLLWLTFCPRFGGLICIPKIFRTSLGSHRCPGPVPGHKLPKLHPNLRASRSGDLTGKSPPKKKGAVSKRRKAKERCFFGLKPVTISQ